MGNAQKSRLKFILIAAALFLASTAAHAKALWVAELDGLGFLLEQAFLLTQNGPSVDGTGNLQGLSMSYQGDAFVLRALQDTDWTQSLPFGIGLYPEVHMPASGDQSYLAFIPMIDFPSSAGSTTSTPIPVPEPSSIIIFFVGLSAAVAIFRKKVR